MPTANLTPDARRELTLRALAGESPTQLAREYGIARTTVYYFVNHAKENAETERRFWNDVSKLVSQ